ncbi:MAG: hypothetical protein ACI4JC_10450 [Faecalibacterium sp.]
MFEKIFLDIINAFFEWVAIVPAPWADVIWPAILVLVSFTVSAVMCCIGVWLGNAITGWYYRRKKATGHTIKAKQGQRHNKTSA